MILNNPPIIIAEAGNNHEGNINVALHMVSLAKECGADIVKFQAGHADGFARYKKDIPRYEKYDLGWEGYKKLYLEGNKLGIPVFFSIWSRDYEALSVCQEWHKIPARQFTIANIIKYDSPKTFISIPYRTYKLKNYFIKQGIPMHCVTQYPTLNPHLEYIPVLRKTLNTQVGYSDHTIGIKACIEAVEKYGAVAIEKHFTLGHYYGELRDHILSADPIEMSDLCRILKGRKYAA